ncbi:MAG: hypothetical protein ABI978_00180 [Chloroflexota bacterium]
MNQHRAAPIAVLALGLAIASIAQGVVPLASPLFDGVVVADPYRYLAPPSGAAGSPTSAAATVKIANGASPAFAVYTDETPPQAELLAHGGELSLRAGTTALKVTIDPITPPSTTPAVALAGNVYRFTVTDQSGAALAVVAGQTITLAMRGPDGISADSSIARLENGAWQAQPTGPSGLQNFLLTNTAAFGDFAILGRIADNPTDNNPLLLIAALIAAGLIGLLGLRSFAMTRQVRGSSPSGGRRPPPARQSRREKRRP